MFSFSGKWGRETEPFFIMLSQTALFMVGFIDFISGRVCFGFGKQKPGQNVCTGNKISDTSQPAVGKDQCLEETVFCCVDHRSVESCHNGCSGVCLRNRYIGQTAGNCQCMCSSLVHVGKWTTASRTSEDVGDLKDEQVVLHIVGPSHTHSVFGVACRSNAPVGSEAVPPRGDNSVDSNKQHKRAPIGVMYSVGGDGE